jgi:A/G-specific adenine glycosylase
MVREIRRRLLAWYDRNRRDLPWRRTRDPYAIWVSEIMLQQTRVETVLPYYDRFLARFPTVQALAEADVDEVLARWSGLGYYRRARSLHRAAATVVERHGGRFPDRFEEVLALPGIGRYTAGAILSIAHDRPHPVLDGNVKRVLARLFRLAQPRPERRLWDLAERLVPPSRPGDFNQALMELGARICVPSSPSCAACPLARDCEAGRAGDPEAFPAPAPPPSRVDARWVAGVARRSGRLLLVRSLDRTVLRGLWEFPGAEPDPGEGEEATVAGGVSRSAGVTVRPEERLFALKHSIMNRSITAVVWRIRVEGSARGGGRGSERRWIRPRDLEGYPITGLTKKIVKRIAAGT